MSLFTMKHSRSCVLLALGLMAGALAPTSAEVGAGPKFNAAGWMQYGAIVKSSDTTQDKDMDGRSIISSGAQFAVEVNPSERLRIEAGIGAAAGHNLAAIRSSEGGYAPVGVGPYVSNANFRYSFWDTEATKLSFRGGLFPYDYNPDAQNLGLYLLRGPVYPGYVMSGFETKAVLPVANTLGFQLHHQTGGFEHDLLVTFETEFYPYWDVSPAYIATYNLGGVFRIGGGVNFYHLIPVDSKLTKDENIIYVDTSVSATSPDTTVLSFAGTKVMMNASLDIKALFGGSESMGPEDLKIYTEVALIGLDNDKAHKALFGEYKDRMPMMAGINLPAFKILDKLALEVEMYSARFKDDITNYNHKGSPSPIPLGKLDTNYSADNLKWSLYGSKVIQNHVKVSLQVASDHFRPGIFKGYSDNNPPSQEAVLFKPSEWYWTSKIAYFF
ncbi:MAG: hypothetical protein JWP91_2232 [Fibrobacteres bacterium]|nr:hypothetical protein [Fibrobacterota bacterium]